MQSVTHGCTHGQAQTNMLPQLLWSWGHNKPNLILTGLLLTTILLLTELSPLPMNTEVAPQTAYDTRAVTLPISILNSVNPTDYLPYLWTLMLPHILEMRQGPSLSPPLFLTWLTPQIISLTYEHWCCPTHWRWDKGHYSPHLYSWLG